MTVFLLDANVLIALVTAEHEHHRVASSWSGGVERFAVCPVVEGAFVRFAIRLGVGAAQAQEVLRRLRRRRGFEFWHDDISYLDVELGQVRGHRQVTDAYLVSLVRSRSDALVATLDQAMVRTWPSAATLVEAAAN